MHGGKEHVPGRAAVLSPSPSHGACQTVFSQEGGGRSTGGLGLAGGDQSGEPGKQGAGSTVRHDEHLLDGCQMLKSTGC